MRFWFSYSRIALFAISTFTLSALSPGVAGAATAMVTVTARVVRNLSVATRTDLSFGDLATSASAGSIVLEDDGVRRALGGAQVEPGGTARTAELVLHGEPKASFTIEIPHSAQLSDSRGDTMQVDQFTTSTGSVGTFAADGQRSVYIGATLHVNSNQALGSYSGTIAVIVNYN